MTDLLKAADPRFKESKISFKKFYLEKRELNADVKAALLDFCRVKDTPLKKFATKFFEQGDMLTLWDFKKRGDIDDGDFKEDEYELQYRAEKKAEGKIRVSPAIKD
jgi:hypothetical protein